MTEIPSSQPAQPYSLDADPAGIRALVADAISGALALGAQNESPAPEGHWLGHFWQLGRQHDEWRSTVWAVARALNCLPSSFSDANGHVLRAAERLMAERTAIQAPEGAEWSGAVAFIQHAQNAAGSAGADGHWPDEFLRWYKPEDWAGEHRAAAVFMGSKIAALAAQPASSVVSDTAPGFSSGVKAPAEGDLDTIIYKCRTATAVEAREYLRTALAANVQPKGSDKANEWRKLAQQFDGQRMAAMVHLRTLLTFPEGHAQAARDFLAATPSEQIASVAPGQAPAPAPLAVPFGMVLVPREPTEDMLSNVDEEVGGHCHSCSKWSASWDDCRRVWAAMVTAAPAVAPLALETAAEARKDREHAEAYYRQAERLLTANEQTLHAEVQRLTAELAASQCAAVGPGWQSIDTAPFDEDLLTFNNSGRIVQDYRSRQYENNWTHWRPLPAEPESDVPVQGSGS